MSGFSAILLLWLLSLPSLQVDASVVQGCLTTSETKVCVKCLRSYTIQLKPLFPVNAVRFLTIKGATICSNPSSPWAIKAMKYLDEKKKTHKPALKKTCRCGDILTKSD
ncbi:hypothetical protein DNTS_029432 [Danionella cerebrum]|uniref:Chemokine interleukin-8-like domain-containing protein n=1 Tax=Danionella cerebrum TaxID=2873325 RepID=A0A553RBY1_9TELE|nr:hypothetical protein DNTS_029432 [Danionella translucida]